MIQRKLCKIKGCKNLTSHKGKNNHGVMFYRTKCQKHHSMNGGTSEKRYAIDNSKCENCGWNKSYCDRHRLIPKLGYMKSNVKVLCPNCHRLISFGLLKFA